MVDKEIKFTKQIDLMVIKGFIDLKTIAVREIHSSGCRSQPIDYIIVQTHGKLLLIPQSDKGDFVMNYNHNPYCQKLFDVSKVTIHNCPNPCCKDYRECLSVPMETCERRIRKYYV